MCLSLNIKLIDKLFFSKTEEKEDLKIFKNLKFNLNSDCLDFKLNSIKPIIYYKWSKQKEKIPEFTLFVGAFIHYNEQWEKKSLLFKIEENEQSTNNILKTIDEFNEMFIKFLTQHKQENTEIKIFTYCNTEEKLNMVSIFRELEELNEICEISNRLKQILEEVDQLRDHRREKIKNFKKINNVKKNE